MEFEPICTVVLLYLAIRRSVCQRRQRRSLLEQILNTLETYLFAPQALNAYRFTGVSTVAVVFT